MAENAVHISSSLQTKPSIFEVIAQECLSELLYPSFKILAQFLGFKNPERYGLLYEWYDEAFLGVNGIIQLHYVMQKDASFSEYFYGLQRGLSENKQDKKLTTNAKIWSFACLVCLPYITRKVNKYIFDHQNGQVGRATLVHRAVGGIWRAVCFTQYLLYLTGQVNAHSPLLSFARLALHYRSDQPDDSCCWRDCLTRPRVGLSLLGSGLTQGLELGAFFLQCLQWWHSNGGGSERNVSTVPDPPPTPLHVECEDLTLCPVCKNPCKIETALLTSGYVFCYRCIRNAVISKQQCPVTRLPATLDELVRLYPTK